MKDIKNILLLLIFIYLFYCSFLKCENFIFCNFSEISCDFNHDGKEPTLCPSPECDGCPNKCPDDCKFHICRRKDPTSYKAKESFLPYSLERNVNCDIGDYGAILQDIIGGRSDPFVLEYLCVKLKNVLLDENSFKEPFGGANVTLIMAIGQVLGGQGKLIPQLDCLIREVQKRYSFNKNCNFQGGNTCMDDYVIDASANAWRAVWEIKNGRIFGDIIGAFKLENNFTFSIISNAQDSILRSLSPDESICVRSNTELMQEQSKWVSKCLDSSYPLETLIKNGQAKVMNFNHVFPDDNFENPNYGVGLLSTLSTAFYGLKLAGHQFKLTDSFKKLLGRELFFNALNQINFDGTEFLQNCLWRTCQNSNPTSCFENAYCWDPYICDRDIKCGSSYNLSADLCNDPGNPGIRYHPQMYPIFDFLVSEFDLSYNTNSFKFDYFNGEYFKPQKDFFNDGRAIIYRNLGWEWPYKEKAPKLLGLPAMWVDVPPVPDASGQPAKICKGNFYGWVYTDEGANGTNRTSACAKIVDANSSCWTEPYPCENNNPSPVPISLVVKRDDVCEAYHNAFMDPLFYHDPSCNGVTDERKIGWEVNYIPSGIGQKKLLVWFKDNLGNLKCFERPFEAVNNCLQAPPTYFTYLSPLDGEYLYNTNSVILKWLPSANADNYDIYFGENSNPPLIKANESQTFYQVNNLVEGKSYYWKIVAKGEGGQFVGDIWGFTIAQSCTSPSIPNIQNLAYDLEPCADSGVLIHWPAHIEQDKWNDGCSGNKCYNRKFEIYRKKGIIGSWELIHSEYQQNYQEEAIPIPDREWIDTTGENGINYQYKIRYINNCGLSTDTAIDEAIDNIYNALPATIEGQNSNICPNKKVTLSVRNINFGWQWYFNESIIEDANSAIYNAAQSGKYIVTGYQIVNSETGEYCFVSSQPFEVQIVPCPDIVFDHSTEPIQISGDNDNVIEAGERWQMSVFLKNIGGSLAKGVEADVEGTDLLIYYNPIHFGDIDIGQTKEATFEFTPNTAKWYSQNSCGSSCILNLINIKSDKGSIVYQNINNFYSLKVGNEEKEEAIANDITLTTANPQKEEIFSPSFSYQSPVYSANVFYNLSCTGAGCDTKKCTKVELVKGYFNTLLKNYNSNPTYDATLFYNQKGAGQYKLRVTKNSLDCSGIYYSKENKMIVYKTEPECDTSIAFYPDQGTTAGGTEVQIFGSVGAFEEGASVYFDLSNSCPQDEGTKIPAESVEFIDSSHLKVITPTSYEGPVSIFVDNLTIEDICQTSAYNYKTLAFTANQVTQDISIIDTKENKIFEPKGQFNFSGEIIPMSSALSKGNSPARKIYIANKHGGTIEIYDSSNFKYEASVNLMGEGYVNKSAFDIDISSSNKYGYVPLGFRCPAAYDNPSYPGGITIIDLENNSLVDADNDIQTTTFCAPEGISRIDTYPMYPVSLKVVGLEKSICDYGEGEKYPGEYLFVSGTFRPFELPPCEPGRICPPLIFPPTKMGVQVYDISPYIARYPKNPPVTEPPDACRLPNLEPNPDYLKRVAFFGDGSNPSEDIYSIQGLDFAIHQNGVPTGATVYILNPYENYAYIVEYDAVTVTFSLKTNPDGTLFKISTGQSPTDVKVQKVLTQTGYQTYAYITNALDDSVTVIDTATNQELPWPQSPIFEDYCYDSENYPTSFDTRSTGDFGYSSNFHSNTVSPFYLPTNSCYSPPGSDGAIHVGGAPIRIVVQPVPSGELFFKNVKDALSFATPSDFTTPSKQAVLIRDWEKVQELQETNANPKAVLSNIENFQKNVNKWIVNENLKKNVNDNVNLYRAGYILDHPEVK